MTTERIDVLAVMDMHLAAMAAGRSNVPCANLAFYDESRKQFEQARAAVAELIEAANAIIPKGDAVWRGAGDFEHATFGVFRKDWDRFTAAITKAGEK